MAGFTHYLPAYARRLPNGLELAMCDTWIRPQQHATEPTCPVCQQLLADEDRQIEQLQTTDWPPAPPLTLPEHINAGGRPKETR